MGTIKVVLRKCRKLNDGRYPLVVRLTHNRKVKYIFTGHSALVSEWNGRYPNFLNNKHPNQIELNNHLMQLYTNAVNQQLGLEKQGNPYNVRAEMILGM